MSRLKKSAALAALCCAFVGGKEGLELVTAPDPVGIPTYCFGETKNAKLGDRYTKPQCEKILIGSLVEHETGMRKCMRDPDGLPEPTYAALLSFTYNVGTGNFCASTLARKLNAGDVVGACNELPRWNKSRGIVWRGLVIRRDEEKAMCMRGVV